MSTYTNAEKQREAAREAIHRDRIYKKMVDYGHMDVEEAKRRVAIMREIATDYYALTQKEQPPSEAL